jgi:hypothetical protein
MPIPIERQSLKTDLNSRYVTQREGGAFDAKLAGTGTAPQSLLGALYLIKNGFLVRESTVESNFKGTDQLDYTEISLMAKGLDTTKYKG